VKEILLGHDSRTGEAFRVPKKAFDTHFHFIGGTGKGKTTAIHTLLRPLLRDPLDRSCFIIIDRLGNLSEELLIWMASEDFCSDEVRERLVYIQPSREDVVLPFNPLLYETQEHGFYKVERTTEIVLRAWESTNIEAMPRLARWTFNAFWAAARLGLTVSDAEYLLLPGTDLHNAIMRRLPDDLRAEWKDIYSARNMAETTRILDSTRNRLKPFFESGILRRMFGSVESRFDVASLMREGKIVLIDLAPRNRLASQLANTIGALMLNEILQTARSLPRLERYPTYIFLDEFQNFVGPDIKDSLPEVRQLGIKFLLSHQSLSQLSEGPYDLTQMIFQAQSRMVFGMQGEDADLLAHELASITFDPDRIKDERYTTRQLVRGHRIIELSSRSDGSSSAETWNQQSGRSRARNSGEVRSPHEIMPTKSEASSRADNESRARGGQESRSSTFGVRESVLPEYEKFLELANRTYRSFEEQRSIWARDVRNLRTGQALVRLVDDPNVRLVNVKQSATSYLKHDLGTLAREFPELLEKTQALIEANFKQDIFVSATVVDRQIEERLGRILNGDGPSGSALIEGPRGPFA
jgi:hypothetical protein